MPFDLDAYIPGFREALPWLSGLDSPWAITSRAEALIRNAVAGFGEDDYRNEEAGVCIHRTARIEAGAVIKPPALIMAGAVVAAHAYLRGGVVLGAGTTVGPGCEVKSSIVMERSTLAHFNFVGDSLIGRDVNLEAGAVIANHFNERADKVIWVSDRGRLISTGVTKFGAVVGDGSAIGANAVLSPGSLLCPGSIVGRLALMPPTDP